MNGAKSVTVTQILWTDSWKIHIPLALISPMEIDENLARKIDFIMRRKFVEIDLNSVSEVQEIPRSSSTKLNLMKTC